MFTFVIWCIGLSFGFQIFMGFLSCFFPDETPAKVISEEEWEYMCSKAYQDKQEAEGRLYYEKYIAKTYEPSVL